MLEITSTRPLNNGVEMPILGFGIFQTSPEDTVSSVKEAIKRILLSFSGGQVGYRLIVTGVGLGE